MPDNLESTLERLHESLPVPHRSTDELLSAIDRRVTVRRHNRRRTLVIGCAVVTAIGAGGIATYALRDDDPTHTITVVTASSAPEPTASSTATTVVTPTTDTPHSGEADDESPWIEKFGDAPLSVRAGAAVVSMGVKVLMWGGSEPNHQDSTEFAYADGAVLDPATSKWDPMAPSPLPGGPAEALWTGSLAVVANADRFATYDPATDAWQSIELPQSQPIGFTSMVLSGDEVVFLPAAMAWNPTTGAWRQFAPPPDFATTAKVVAWRDHLVVSWAGITPDASKLLMYDPATDAWSSLPTPPFTTTYDGEAAGIVGDELVIASWLEMRVLAFDLDGGEWRELPRFPQLSVKCSAEVAGVDGDVAVVSMCGQRAALAPGADHWVPFQSPVASITADQPFYGQLLIPYDDDKLLINNTVLDTRDPSWLSSPQLGPVTIGGLTITRTPHDSVTGNDGSSVAFDIAATGCQLVANHSDTVAADQKLLAEVAVEAEASPPSVEFWNTAGHYSLTCPSAASYAESISRIFVRGELTAPPTDGLDQLGVLPLANPSVEGEAYALSDAVQARYPGASVGLGYPSHGVDTDQPHVIVDVYPDTDDLITGYRFDVTMQLTQEGWAVESASVQTVCALGVDPDDRSTCR